MKKVKRMLALAGAVVLAGMYILTLVFALMDRPGTDRLLMASVGCTIIFPVLLYGYILVYRVTRPDSDGEEKGGAGETAGQDAERTDRANDDQDKIKE